MSAGLNERLARFSKVAERLARPELRSRLIESIHEAVGKPLDWCAAEVDFCIESFTSQAPEFRESFAVQRIEDSTRVSEIHHLPLGTVLVFSPFNSPLECLQLGLLPALAAGNSVVVKATDVAVEPVRLFLDAFRPEFEIELHSGGPEVGRSLIERSDVALVVFTGSQAVGREIASLAGRLLKPVILELGGKDALVVMSDANLDEAVESAISGAFGFAGQVCTASERVMVESSISEQFEAKLVAKVGAKLKSGWTERLVSSSARDRVAAAIEQSVSSGAALVCGGAKSSVDSRAMAPAILKNVPRESMLAREEIFGPVMSLETFSSDGELVERLGTSDFALGLTILTSDVGRARALALRLPNAMVGIGGGCIGVQGTPWLGNRSSGLGMLGSIEGHRAFASKRVITRSK